jgi:DNA-binding transcriptional MerR regulator
MPTVDLSRREFTARQAADVTGATSRQLVYWDNKGLLKPSVRPANGRGSRRLYSYTDLVAIQAIRRLRDEGMSLQKIGRCVRYLRRHMPDVSKPLSYCSLVARGDDIALVEDPQTLVSTVKQPGQRAMLQLAIDQIDHDLRRRISDLMEPAVHEVEIGDSVYQVEVEPDEDGGFVAEVAGLPGCITQGGTLGEVLEMAKDAILSYFEAVEELRKMGKTVPPSNTIGGRKRA